MNYEFFNHKYKCKCVAVSRGIQFSTICVKNFKQTFHIMNLNFIALNCAMSKSFSQGISTNSFHMLVLLCCRLPMPCLRIMILSRKKIPLLNIFAFFYRLYPFLVLPIYQKCLGLEENIVATVASQLNGAT